MGRSEGRLSEHLRKVRSGRALIGQTLAHYRVTAAIGAGGMGEVYRATDTRLGREVAIKVLPAEMAASPERLERFRREARAVAALNHPHIVTIHSVEEADGVHFLTMELVEGQPLDRLIPERGLPVARVLEIAIALAKALAAAHDRGIVHRDLKPGNVMIAKDGRLKVLDFGLAKLLPLRNDAGLGEDPTISRPPHTAAGTVLGTVGYMAPEQVRGLPADHRSDLFSFGALLYEMLRGRRAFKGDTAAETMYAILKQDPLETGGTERPLPLGVERILRRCLEKGPEERFQSARDLAFHLEAISGASDAAEPRAARGETRPRRRWAWAALPLALVAAFLSGGRAWRAAPSTAQTRVVPLTTLPGVERYPSFSPDGNHVAITWTGPQQDNPDIYVQMIGSGSPLRLTTDPSNDYSPAWAPDGRFIAFLRRQWEAGKSELRLIPPLGGPERKLAEIRVSESFVAPPYLAWCPDSTCLVVADSPGEGRPVALFVISLESGEKRQLTHPEAPRPGDTNPAVSPDGRWLVFRRNASGPYTGELYLLALGRGLTAAGEPRRLTLAGLDADSPTWMPDSKEIVFSAGASLWRVAVPGDRAPTRLPFVGEDAFMPVVSRPPPGRPPRLVYVRRFQDTNVWRLLTSAPGAMASAPPVVSISSTRGDLHPQYRPDGRRVAFSSDRSGEWEIWLADPDGSNAIQLTSLGASSGYPRWSPDGDRIAFHSSLGGQWEVYVIPAEGGKPRNLTAHPATDTWPSFSRDGRWVYFNSNRTGERQIWKMPASGGEPVQMTNNVGHTAFESPDGAHLFYTQTRDTPSPLWSLPTGGGVPVKVLEGVVLANFVVLAGGIYSVARPSGEGGLHNTDRPAGETRLQYFDLRTRRSTTVARNLGNVDIGLTATPDGRAILFSRVDSSVDDLMLVENFH